jgi:hypothetical protein
MLLCEESTVQTPHTRFMVFTLRLVLCLILGANHSNLHIAPHLTFWYNPLLYPTYTHQLSIC